MKTPALAILMPFRSVQALDQAITSVAAATPGTHTVYSADLAEASYSLCINDLYHANGEQLILLSGEEQAFPYGWFTQGLKWMGRGVSVVGLGEAILVKRSYIKKYSGVVDMPNTVLYPYRTRQAALSEFIETAKARGVYLPCITAKIAPLAIEKPDEEDIYLYGQRKALWESLEVEE